MINPKYRFFYSRIYKNLLGKLNIKNKENNLIKKVYNFNQLKLEIIKKFRLNEKNLLFGNNVLFCSFENKSGWLEEFKNNHKVIFFPEKSNLVKSKTK